MTRLLLITLLSALTLTAGAADSFKPGQHYTGVSPAVGTSVEAGKIEVVELFWYGCPHCFQFEPEIEQWLADWQARSDADDLNQTEKFLVELNQFTDWVQRRAEHAEIDAHSDPLLMAILGGRQVVVRRLSEDPPESED